KEVLVRIRIEKHRSYRMDLDPVGTVTEGGCDILIREFWNRKRPPGMRHYSDYPFCDIFVSDQEVAQRIQASNVFTWTLPWKGISRFMAYNVGAEYAIEQLRLALSAPDLQYETVAA
ncbi:MAG TPA: hypothetical protein VI958_05420, partial [Acidobacteriota bacterium]